MPFGMQRDTRETANMQHWTGISRWHVFVATASVLIGGASNVADVDWTRSVTDVDWTRAMADIDWTRTVTDIDWTRAMADVDWN
jgi:hypothetical protein